MKPYYADYVRHALRFFAKHRHDMPPSHLSPDGKNWRACESAFTLFDTQTQEMFMSIYESGQEMFSATVMKAAVAYDVSVNHMWQKINTLERTVALMRGLI